WLGRSVMVTPRKERYERKSTQRMICSDLAVLRYYDDPTPDGLASRVVCLERILGAFLPMLFGRSPYMTEVLASLRQAMTCEYCGSPLSRGVAIYSGKLLCPLNWRPDCVDAVRQAMEQAGTAVVPAPRKPRKRGRPPGTSGRMKFMQYADKQLDVD